MFIKYYYNVDMEVGLGTLSSSISLSLSGKALQPHELQHTRLPNLSRTPGAYSNSCLLSH